MRYAAEERATRAGRAASAVLLGSGSRPSSWFTVTPSAFDIPAMSFSPGRAPDKTLEIVDGANPHLRAVADIPSRVAHSSNRFRTLISSSADKLRC
jgi:hypothetical protein